MALLDTIRGLGRKAGSNLDEYVGGLLGEDAEKLTERERQQMRREALMAIFEAMGSGAASPRAGLEGVAKRAGERITGRMAAEQQGRDIQDITQAQAAIAGRLGARGADVGEQTQLEEVRPMSGMNLEALVASPAGAAAMQSNPQLAEMLKQRTGYQVAGADIFNRATGQFVPRPSAAPRANVAPVATRPGAAPAPAAGGSRFVTMTPDQLRQANLPEGTSAQLDTQTGQIKVISAVPATQRTGEAAKGTAVKRVDDVAGKIESQLNNVRTGGPLGVVGALSRVFDSQDAKLFESYRQQLSSALRTALRIPGEGALSDFEQRQYGLQLPELGQSSENNIQIIRSLQNQVRLAAGLPPLEEPAANAGGGAVDYIYKDGRLVPARKP
jgi:hypothetical protein